MKTIVLFAGGGTLLIAVVTLLSSSLGLSDPLLIYHTVRRGDLQITVTERGNLQSQDEVKVICEVDDIHGDNIHGTPILWVIPNGSSVKKGDLVFMVDSWLYRSLRAGFTERYGATLHSNPRCDASALRR